MTIVDSHQHFWNPAEQDLPPPPAKYAPLDRAFLPADLQPDLSKCGVDYTVLVQGYPQTDASNRFLFRQANQTAFVAGVVAWADLEDTDRLCRQLDDLATEPKFVGVRHIVQEEPDPQFLLREPVLASLRELAHRAVPYDMVVYQRHLPVVIQTVDQVPELRVVIDHIGKPDIAGGDTAGWERDIAELAQRPLVHCKLSGVATEADWKTWRPADIEPCIERVVECFGFDRLMYGSDWPVCLLATDYGRFWQTLQSILAGIGEENHTKLFGNTAAHFYGLTLPAAQSD